MISPRLVDRHERAEAAHVDQHRAAFHRINPHGCALDRRCGWFEPRQNHRHEADDKDAGNGEGNSAQFLLARYGRWSLNIHFESFHGPGASRCRPRQNPRSEGVLRGSGAAVPGSRLPSMGLDVS